jgi:hypothetical protein
MYTKEALKIIVSQETHDKLASLGFTTKFTNTTAGKVFNSKGQLVPAAEADDGSIKLSEVNTLDKNSAQYKNIVAEGEAFIKSIVDGTAQFGGGAGSSGPEAKVIHDVVNIFLRSQGQKICSKQVESRKIYDDLAENNPTVFRKLKERVDDMLKLSRGFGDMPGVDDNVTSRAQSATGEEHQSQIKEIS